MVDFNRHEGHGLSTHDESMERSYRSEIDGNVGSADSSDAARDKKMRRLRIVVLVALAATVVAAGVVIASNLGSHNQAQTESSPVVPAATTAPVTPSPTPTASATASATAAATARPSTPDLGWTSFVSTIAHAQFDLPAGWTATDAPIGTASNPPYGIQVTDEHGIVMAKFYHLAVGGVGGACGPGIYKQTELDSAATSLQGQWVTDSQVRFSYRVLDQTAQGKGISYQIGLVDKSSGEVQDSCLMYTFVQGAPKGTLSFATSDSQVLGPLTFSTMDEARQYMQTAEYQKLKRMITSLQLTQ
ncbi:hypothetical protein AB4Z38_19140 [Arthrobacter sp. 2RAF6]|uniref:hypothetical protein n=1 Tax=Arthrobacter sp. 2RAF6 TaxID=3233002 RepID=UPI003F8F7763